MTRRTLTRWLTPLALASALVVALPSTRARAEPVGEGEVAKEEGRSFDGYMATFVLAGLALFVFAKSARR
jgi:hypothetical protein